MINCTIHGCRQLAKHYCGCEFGPLVLCQVHFVQHLSTPGCHLPIDTCQTWTNSCLQEVRHALTCNDERPQPTCEELCLEIEVEAEVPCKRLPSTPLDFGERLESDPPTQAYAEQLRRKGEAWKELGRVEEAIQLYSHCAQVLHELNLDSTLAPTLNTLGSLFYTSKHYKEAIDTYQRSLSAYAHASNSRSVAFVYYNLGLALYCSERYSQALAAFQKSIAVPGLRGLEYALMLYNLGKTHIKLRHLDEAIQVLSSIRDCQAQRFSLKLVADAHRKLGNAFQAKQLHERARHKYSESIRLYMLIGQVSKSSLMSIRLLSADEPYLCKERPVLLSAALCKAWKNYIRECTGARLSELLEKDQCLQRSVRMQLCTLHDTKDLEPNDYLGRAVTKLGSTFLALGKKKRALDILRSERRVGPGLSGTACLATRKFVLAAAYYSRGKCDYAIRSLRQSINLYRKAGLQSERVDAVLKLGGCFATNGEYGKAISLRSRSMNRILELGLEQAHASNLYSLGFSLSKKAAYKNSIEAYERAHVLFGQLDLKTNQAAVLRNLASTYVKSDFPNNAIAAYQQAIQINKQLCLYKEQTITLLSLGHVFGKNRNRTGQTAAYLESIQISEQFGFQAEHAQALRYLASVFGKTGRFQEELAAYRESVQLYQALGFVEEQVQALFLLGHSCRRKGRYQEAIEAIQQSIRLYESSSHQESRLRALLLELAEVFELTQQSDQAISLYRELLSNSLEPPTQARITAKLGLSLERTNQLADAVECLQQAANLYRGCELNTQYSESLLHLGIALDRLGNYQDALKTFEMRAELTRRSG